MPYALDPAIVVVSGLPGSGKTTACRRLAKTATAVGWQVTGLVCPAVLRAGEKVAIDAVDLRSGLSRRLAERREAPPQGELGYAFDDVALAWADAVVARATPCDLLFVDELGPLELLQGRGLLSAFAVLGAGRYGLAVVVVRPELVETFRARLDLPCVVSAPEALARTFRAMSPIGLTPPGPA